MQPRRVLLITDNERYGGFLRSRLEEEGFSTDVLTEKGAGVSKLAKGDLAILDAHAEDPKGRYTAVRRIRTAREKHDVGTPFIILTWVLPREIVNIHLASNPFIGQYYRESCRFLWLPVSLQRLAQTVELVQPCTEKKINEGKRFLDYINHVHRTNAH